MKNKLIPYAALVAALLVSLACQVTTFNPTVRGSGKVVSEERQVSGFDAVEFSGVGELIISTGDSESLEIEAEDNLLEKLETTVEGSVLHIRVKPLTANLRPTKPIIYRLVVKSLNRLTVSGAGKASAGALEADDFSLEVSGAGDAVVESLEVTNTLDVELSGAGSLNIGTMSANLLALSISGAGKTTAAGHAERLKLEISGAGSADLSNLEVRTADVNMSGAGSAQLWVEEMLDAQLSGAGDLEYYGAPVTTIENSGTGKVNWLGDN